MKVVLNREFGGFQLTKAAYNYMDIPWDGYGFLSKDILGEYPECRTHPKLVECVEMLGSKAGDSLKVIEIPDDIAWSINYYDGYETIHRSW